MWKQQQCLKWQNHMTIILSEVAVLKTGTLCLINTKFMMLLGAYGFIYWQKQDTFLFSNIARPVLGPTQPPLQWVPRSFLAKSGWGVQLTTHMHLLQRLRMTGAITLLPLHAFKVWTETILLSCVCVCECACTHMHVPKSNIPASSMDSVQIFVAPPQIHASFWTIIK